MILHNFDAEQVLIQDVFNMNVYTKVSPGCGDLSGKRVLFNKSLPCLKQAARS